MFTCAELGGRYDAAMLRSSPWPWILLTLLAGALAGVFTTLPGSRASSTSAPGSEARKTPSGLPAPAQLRPAAEEAAEVLQALERALAAVPPESWEERVEAAGISGLDDAVPLLVRAFRRSGEDRVRLAVLRALEAIGGPHAALALARLSREWPPLEEQAGLRLSRLGERRAAPALVNIIEEEEGEGPLAAAGVRALGRTRLRQYVPLLKELALGAQDQQVRLQAVESLGLIADPDGFDALERLLIVEDVKLRRQVIQAMGRIRTPRSLELLEGLLATGPEGREKQLIEEAIAGLKGLPRGSPWGR
jgi:HEAT repeat protein